MELRTVLRDDPSEVRRARRLVSDHLEGWGLRDLDQVTILLVSELVTNALLHGHPPLRLVARDILTGVRIEVHDNNPEGAPQKRPDGGFQSGRGLQLVDSLATRWGWVESGNGKCVWFEVDLVWSQFNEGNRTRATSDPSAVPPEPAAARAEAPAGPVPLDTEPVPLDAEPAARSRPPADGRRPPAADPGHSHPGHPDNRPAARTRAGAVEGHKPARGSLAG
ncbi:MAG TPA: ATP-binding protein [Actinomycetes bacterium]|nr:ATP-binding protein [Actinomycetes bacterium]